MNKIEEINNIIEQSKKDKIISTKDISDRHHKFGDLYKHRTYLFAVICN